MLEKILQAIEDSSDELLDFAGEFIGFATPDPPAHNTAGIQKWLAETLQAGRASRPRCSTCTRTSPSWWESNPGSAAAHPGVQRPRGRGPGQPGGEVGVRAVHPPAADSRYLYGRGSADMKGGMAAAYWAVKTLADLGVQLDDSLMFQSVVGEEAGEHGTKTCWRRGSGAISRVIPEPSELKIGGQGGVVTMWVIVRSPKTYHDGLRSRMIHAGGGIDAASAIEKMVHILQGMQELERHWAVTRSYPGMTRRGQHHQSGGHQGRAAPGLHRRRVLPLVHHSLPAQRAPGDGQGGGAVAPARRRARRTPG